MKTLLFYFVLIFQVSCKKQEVIPPLCDGGCDAVFYIDKSSNPDAYIGSDGHWRVKWQGFNYFTVKGDLTNMTTGNEINGVPNVETWFDSDYWLTIGGLTYKTPMYSAFHGYFNDQDLSTPLSIGDKEYTILEWNRSHSSYNIIGYEIQKYTCFNCPYSPTLFGVKSKYTYEPQISVFFDERMIGDTVNIHIKIHYLGAVSGERFDKQIKVIFE